MAYSVVTFTAGEVLPAAKLQQLSDNDAYLKAHVDVLESPQGATITYAAGDWRVPTTAVAPFLVAALVIEKIGSRVFVRGGSVENASTRSLGVNGQVVGAMTLPAGFRPARAVIIPSTVDVAAAFLAAGQAVFNPDGGVTLQTTTAWSNVPAGAGRFNIGAASWLAAS